jgi:hypothetical protein
LPTNLLICYDDAWALELKTAPEAELPFLSVDETQIRAAYNGFAYGVFCKKKALSSKQTGACSVSGRTEEK